MRLFLVLNLVTTMSAFAQIGGGVYPGSSSGSEGANPPSYNPNQMRDYYQARERLLNLEQELLQEKLTSYESQNGARLPEGVTLDQLRSRVQELNFERLGINNLLRMGLSPQNPYGLGANPYGFGFGGGIGIGGGLYPYGGYAPGIGVYGAAYPYPSLAGCEMSNDSNTISCPQGEYVRSRAVAEDERDRDGERPGVGNTLNPGGSLGGTSF